MSDPRHEDIEDFDRRARRSVATPPRTPSVTLRALRRLWWPGTGHGRPRSYTGCGVDEAEREGGGDVSGNITDPDDDLWTGCTEDCPDDCAADHGGEE